MKKAKWCDTFKIGKHILMKKLLWYFEVRHTGVLLIRLTLSEHVHVFGTMTFLKG